MTGDCHVRICEGRRVKLPPATRQPMLPVQMRLLDVGDSVPCPARGWQVLASRDVR